jgi:hypothetical protein
MILDRVFLDRLVVRLDAATMHRVDIALRLNLALQ